ncbi:MAG: Cytochrome B561, partial [Marinobacter sp. T13-3]
IAVAHNAMGALLLVSVVHLIWRHHQLPEPRASMDSPPVISREATA